MRKVVSVVGLIFVSENLLGMQYVDERYVPPAESGLIDQPSVPVGERHADYFLDDNRRVVSRSSSTSASSDESSDDDSVFSNSSNNSQMYHPVQDFYVLTKDEVTRLVENPEEIKSFIDKGLDINKMYVIHAYPALVYMAEEGHMNVVKALVENGVDINKQNEYGFTALMKASVYGHKSIVEFLLNNEKIDIGIENKVGWTALDLAVGRGQVEIVDSFLKKNPALINSESKQGNTMLAIALVNNQETTVKYLIENNVKIRKDNGDAYNLLWHARRWMNNESCSDSDFWKGIIEKLEKK